MMKLSVKRMFSAVTLLAMVVSASVALSADAATTKTTRYAKWTFADNGSYQFSDYTLSLDLYSGTQARQIYPDPLNPEDCDDRYRSGNTGIVRIMSSQGMCATGFIVGDHTIATAAHCVYKWDDRLNSGYIIPSPSVITYDEDGTPEKTTKNGIVIDNCIDVKEIHIPYEFYSGLNAGTLERDMVHVDYALITVEDDLSGYTHFELGIPYHLNSSQFDQIDLYTTGLPYDLNPVQSEDVVFSAKGKEHPGRLSTAQVLYFTCDSAKGQSGSPIYTATEYYYPGMSQPLPIYTAIAILASDGVDEIIEGSAYISYNMGACMDSSKLQFYHNNPNAST